MNLTDTLKALELTSGASTRMDCPMCGGRNTLSVTNDMGALKWNCYKALCNTKGNQAVTRTAAELKDIFTAKPEDKEFAVPEHFTAFASDDRAVSYVRKNNCFQAYMSGLVDIRLDPRLLRVVFMVKKEGVTIDAVGRAIPPRTIPKWWRYGSSAYPFMCGTSKTAVIVEDAASACAVSAVATGVALLGTSVQDTHIEPLKAFDNILIALDKDASIKSIALHRMLSYYVSCEVRLLDDDLKYYNADQIRDILKL